MNFFEDFRKYAQPGSPHFFCSARGASQQPQSRALALRYEGLDGFNDFFELLLGQFGVDGQG